MVALEGKHPGESPGEEARIGESGFPSRFRQQDLGSLKLVEAENLMALMTAVPLFLVLLCIDGHRVLVLTEMLETAPVIRSLSGQRCVSSCCDVPTSPFPKALSDKKGRKMKNHKFTL